MLGVKGFTLIEILIVISLIMILGLSSAPFLSNFIKYNNFDSATQNVVGSLRKAQANAMSNRQGVVWGVCVQGSTLRLYSGTCASPTFAQNTPLQTGITVTGLSDVTFNRRGEPSSALSVVVSSGLESKSFTVNSAGRISGP
jgi:prepilin-type N-terminal cleavage/methylation domain-containing protein